MFIDVFFGEAGTIIPWRVHTDCSVLRVLIFTISYRDSKNNEKMCKNASNKIPSPSSHLSLEGLYVNIGAIPLPE